MSFEMDISTGTKSVPHTFGSSGNGKGLFKLSFYKQAVCKNTRVVSQQAAFVIILVNRVIKIRPTSEL